MAAAATMLSKTYVFKNSETENYISQNILPSKEKRDSVKLDILEIIRKIANEILKSQK
ncbi:MAG: hypothetical protein JXA94_02405 [Parachlamydiales bacterium]|nr:hypothetical protein [Parachlamydiales bacterium]